MSDAPARPGTPALSAGAQFRDNGGVRTQVFAFRGFVRAIAFAAVVVPALAHAQSDADFLAAKAAFERNDARRLAALAPSFAGHLLEPYVAYWQIRLSLDTVDPSVVRSYLSRHASVPIAETLRTEWLKSLAVRGQWATFGEDYVALPGEDAELACHAIQHRRQREGDAVLAQARRLWFTGRATPDACEPLFAELIANGALSPDDGRARMRLASEAGNARLAQAIAKSLPAGDRVTDAELARVDRNPVAALSAAAFPRNASGRELALYALERAARRDAMAARAAWVKARGALPEADRNHGNARLAFHAARQHVHDAYVYFREAGNTPLGEEQHAWRVRAALRAGAWTDVAAAIEAMPAEQRDEAAWRYWAARAKLASGDAQAARHGFESLAKEFNFYGVLAAEAIGAAVEPASEPLAPTAEALAALGARTDVQRALKLLQLDMRMDGLREWARILRGMDDPALLVTADFARRAGHYDRAINTAERTAARHDFALRYLMPFRGEFASAAREQDLDPALLYAIARQESRFIPDIVSSAGAQGLMQLMPATARWVAKQLGEASYRGGQITDIGTNTRFGAFYFRHCLDRLDSHAALAAAAYNAGPGRAQAWRPAAALEGAVWVETIPFNETRDYVKKVLSNAMFYTHALGQPSVTLTSRLSAVSPRMQAAAPGAGMTAAN